MNENIAVDCRSGTHVEECSSKKYDGCSLTITKEDADCGPSSPDISSKGRVRKKRMTSPGEDMSPKRRKSTRKKAIQVGKLTPAYKDFFCDRCNSPFVTNPTRRGSRPKASRSTPAPRRRTDPQTGQTLTLCNACGISFGKLKRSTAPGLVVEPGDRARHEEQLEAFSRSMVELLGDQDAEKLVCPVFRKKPCQCLQNYIKRTGDTLDACHSRALQMLALLKEALVLGAQKCYNTSSLPQEGKAKKPVIGLGNGQRKSKEFEEFVMTNRKTLREEYKLCERACQRILGYSNNFLHKRLKTDPQKRERIVRTKGKRTLGLLKPICELRKERCCLDNCVVMAHTHPHLLQQWRERAQSGQTEARRVLAEMLTPSGGGRCNCYKFIMWVSGCSQSTISKVSEQMRRTGGDREPPPHGMKKWIKDHPRPKKKTTKPAPVILLPNLPQASAVPSATGAAQGVVSASGASLSQPLVVTSEPPSLLTPTGPSIHTAPSHTLTPLATCGLISGAAQLILQGIEQSNNEGGEKIMPGSLMSSTVLHCPGVGISELPTSTLPLTAQSVALKGSIKPPIENEYLMSSEEDHAVLWAP
ncbi:uncharacterized protein LOC136758521 [Amia ocellicauda]|uniref:uncharacterized protein LOC136758521 n=1 Tax=Amia ocellicauda TaxID=2972642 RepID=UPI0034643701